MRRDDCRWHSQKVPALFALVLMTAASLALADDANRLSYLDSNEVWFPNKEFPKLTCPQWVGDDGVECVVVLAIDDMREPAKYEAYLRPILQRLKAIDGRAPVSIMTCAVKPDDPQLQSWLNEGLSLECHTFTHPCPLLTGKDIKTAKSSYDKCVDLMAQIPNSKPVAFRTPCCDSLNTVSPRFYSEIFNKTTPEKNFLQLDSSVFTLYTADDPSIPREMLVDADGREKFRKYVPRALKRGDQIHDHFVNTIENYPYPYAIQNVCWQFPCMVPSDWSANHLQQPNNPDTVRDLKVALDITVMKQGVMNLVFHPHGWIKAEQVVDLIDHAVSTHGKKVKFLNFRECVDRLNKNVLGGQTLRDQFGQENGVRLIDVTRDGLIDVVLQNKQVNVTRVWSPQQNKWIDSEGPPVRANKAATADRRFADLNGDGNLDLIVSNSERFGAWLFESKERGWAIELLNSKRGDGKANVELPPITREDGSDNGFFVRDRELCWINEDTSELPDLMIRISFDQLLGDRLPDAKSPAAAIKSMRVRPGYQIELAAHEPLTMDPVAFDWGPDGKMWVAEMADYPLGIDGHGAPGGRIRYLEDTDADGRYDKSTLFLDKVPYPNGVLAWKRGVLISAAPDVFYAEDTDGDGKADRREVLFTGFVEGNQQHRANGFVRGFDNWLYLANGDSGGTVKSVKTGKTLDLRGYDIRIRPETGAMETIAGASQFGRHRDDWGNWFGNNNSRPMWHFVLDDHYLRRNPFLAAPAVSHDVSVTPGAAPVFPSSKTLTRFNDFHTANRFTSACATIVYRDNTLFGPAVDTKHRDGASDPEVSHAFVSEPVHNLVHHEVMTADGSSFTSRRAVGEEQSEFVSSTDNWFRPTTLRTGPDGSLWIADMYRLVIEHPQWIPIEWQRKLNVRAGDDKGRIWRVSPVGAKPFGVPRFDKMSPPELVVKLDSSNGWQRDLVQQLLIDAADASTIPMLRTQARESKNVLCRLHSLCTLDGIEGGLTAELVAQALGDTHPGIRRHALRLLEAFPQPDAATIERLSKLVDDPDPQVRIQLAYSLAEFKHPQAGTLLGQLALRSSGDPYQLAAVMSSFSKENLADVLTVVLKNGAEQSELLQRLLDQAAAFQHDPSLIVLLNRATEPAADKAYANWQYSAIEQFQRTLGRRGDSLAKWLGGLKSDSRLMELRLQALFHAARKQATNNKAAVADRVAAVRVLGQSTDQAADTKVLIASFTPQEAPELQSAVLTALSRLTAPELGTKLISSFRSFGPGLRSQMCDVLLSREKWRDELLSALESKTLTPADLDATARQRLLAHRSKDVQERAAKVLAVDLNTDRAKLVSRYLPEVRAGGDIQQGGQLFQKMCSQCHKLGNVGHVVGPDLSSLADKSAEVLLTAVLDPNRAVETRYLTFTAVTTQGVAHTGIIASETSSSVTLRSAEGKEVTLLRSEIDELQSTSKSLMPEGLEKDLKPADAAALISFIRRNVPLPAMKSFPGNHPRVVQADASGSLTLTPSDAEIYGSTIVVEPQHKNLGWWSSADDIVVWTITVPKSGIYTVSWTWACDPQASGNSVTVEAAGKSLTRPVRKTANWDDYQTAVLGELELPEGEIRVTMKPASRPLPALADVQSVVLRPKQ